MLVVFEVVNADVTVLAACTEEQALGEHVEGHAEHHGGVSGHVVRTETTCGIPNTDTTVHSSGCKEGVCRVDTHICDGHVMRFPLADERAVV